MKIVVTGGAGFIGANLCRRLAARGGCELVVVDDLSTGRAGNLAGLDIEVCVASVLDQEVLLEVCRGAHSIVHLAAVPSVPRSIADPVRSHDVNASGTLNVLEAARAHGAHVVVASSSSVYGRNPVQPKSENMPCMPASPYAASKAAAEAYTRSYQTAYGLEALVFRFFNVFGPLQPADHAYAAVLPAFIAAGLRGQALPVYGDGEQSRDFTFVGTVADILAQSAVHRRTHAAPVNLAFGSSTTLNQLIDMLAAIIGEPLTATYGAERAGDVRHSQADNTVLRGMFPGVHPAALDLAVAETVDWMRGELTEASRAAKAVA